jgi:hypothetical protein
MIYRLDVILNSAEETRINLRVELYYYQCDPAEISDSSLPVYH